MNGSEFSYEQNIFKGLAPERHRRAHCGRGGGLISPARADWMKSGTADYVSVTVPAATLTIGPGQPGGYRFDSVDGTPTRAQSQEFTWFNAGGQNTPYVATATLTMNTGGSLIAKASPPQGNAQASIAFIPQDATGGNDYRHAQSFGKSDPPSAQDLSSVPTTLSFTQQFQTTNKVDATGKIITVVVATFPLKVSNQVSVQGAPYGQAVTGTSTATAGPTNVSTANIITQ